MTILPANHREKSPQKMIICLLFIGFGSDSARSFLVKLLAFPFRIWCFFAAALAGRLMQGSAYRRPSLSLKRRRLQLIARLGIVCRGRIWYVRITSLALPTNGWRLPRVAAFPLLDMGFASRWFDPWRRRDRNRRCMPEVISPGITHRHHSPAPLLS